MAITNWTLGHHEKSLVMGKEVIVKEKDFDTVKYFRSVKEKIAKETEGMSFTELKEFMSNRKIKHGKKPASQQAT